MANCPSCRAAITSVVADELDKGATGGLLSPAPGTKIGVYLCPKCSAVLGVAPDTDEIERAVQAAISKATRRI